MVTTPISLIITPIICDIHTIVRVVQIVKCKFNFNCQRVPEDGLWGLERSHGQTPDVT